MNREMYKNPKLAYLIEVITALLTLIAIGFWGEIGIAVISLIALRPALLEKTEMTPEAVGVFYSIGKTGIIITLLTLVSFYLASEFIFNIETDWKIIVVIIFPYFLLSHGIAGLIYEKIHLS